MARLTAAGCVFLVLSVCSAQESAPTEPGSTVFHGAFSGHVGEEGGGRVFQNSPGEARVEHGHPREAGDQRTVESQAGNSLVSRRRRSSTSSIYKRPFVAGLLSRPSGTGRKLLLATTLSLVIGLSLWRVGKVILECLTEEEVQDRPGLISRSLSTGDRKKKCRDLGLGPSSTQKRSAVNLRRSSSLDLEFLLVTIAVSLIVLAGLGAFVYLAVQDISKPKPASAPTSPPAANSTAAAPTSTPPPPIGPGASAAKTLAGCVMLAAGLFAFYMYLRVQREARRGPPPPGTPSAYTSFFTFWCLIFVISSTLSFLVMGGFTSWLTVAVAFFAILAFLQTYRGTRPLRPQATPRLNV